MVNTNAVKTNRKNKNTNISREYCLSTFGLQGKSDTYTDKFIKVVISSFVKLDDSQTNYAWEKLLVLFKKTKSPSWPPQAHSAEASFKSQQVHLLQKRHGNKSNINSTVAFWSINQKGFTNVCTEHESLVAECNNIVMTKPAFIRILADLWKVNLSAI